MGDAAGGDGSERPRRATPENVDYLLQIDGELDKLLAAEGDGAEEGATILVENVLEELKFAEASLAEDRRASHVLQKVIGACSAAPLGAVLRRFEPYAKHLAADRYASHVLEAACTRAHALLRDGAGDGDGNGDGEVLDELEGAIVGFHDALLPGYLDVACDWVASHSLRALLCVLSGHEVVTEKRGKNSKHRSRLEEADPHAPLAPTAPPRPKLDLALAKVCEQFAEMEVRQLQRLLLDQYCCPVLCLLMRLCAGRAEASLGTFQAVAERALQYEEGGKAHARVMLGMSGELSSSHFVQALLRCAGDAFHGALWRDCFSGRVWEYADHSVSNYVVQSLFASARSAEQATAMLDEALPHFGELLSGNAGVAYNMARCAAAHRVRQKQIVEAVEAWGEGRSRPLFSELLNATNASALRDGVASGVRVMAMGAKLAGEVFTGFARPLGRRLALRLLQLDDVLLQALSFQALTARALIEPLLEGRLAAADGATEGRTLRADLAAKLEGAFSEMATSPAGHHTLIKCFSSAPPEEKRRIATMMKAKSKRLDDSRFGRAVAAAMALNVLGENDAAWRRRVGADAAASEGGRDGMMASLEKAARRSIAKRRGRDGDSDRPAKKKKKKKEKKEK